MRLAFYPGWTKVSDPITQAKSGPRPYLHMLTKFPLFYLLLTVCSIPSPYQNIKEMLFFLWFPLRAGCMIQGSDKRHGWTSRLYEEKYYNKETISSYMSS